MQLKKNRSRSKDTHRHILFSVSIIVAQKAKCNWSDLNSFDELAGAGRRERVNVDYMIPYH